MVGIYLILSDEFWPKLSIQHSVDCESKRIFMNILPFTQVTVEDDWFKHSDI